MPRPDLYFLRLNLDEVRRLALEAPDRTTSRAAATPPDNDDVVDWLIARGFRLSRGGWHAGPAALDLLHPAAIRYCEPVRGG